MRKEDSRKGEPSQGGGGGDGRKGGVEARGGGGGAIIDVWSQDTDGRVDKRNIENPSLMVHKHTIFVHFLPPTTHTHTPLAPHPLPLLSDVYSMTPGQS